MNQNTKILLGPPGTGKTTRLMNIMEEEFKNGCPPNKMVFCSFTKKAVSEAINRAVERFGFSRSDMVHFKTIHSLAFHSMGLSRDQVMSEKDYNLIGKHLGLTFSGRTQETSPEILLSTEITGDRYRFIDGLSRAKKLPAKTIWDSVGYEGLNWWEFLRYRDTVAQYKERRGLFDFSDMVDQAKFFINVDVVIIDEAQDLSTAQWGFIRDYTRKAKRMYVGGDDDQAIFSWSGADVNQFLELPGERQVLQQSFRIPQKVHQLASDITKKIKHRAEKTYLPRSSVGSVEYWHNVDHIGMESGTWLLLARNSYLLDEYAVSMKSKGVAFAIRGRNSVGTNHTRAISLFEKWRRDKQPLPLEDLELVRDFLPKGTTHWPDVIWHKAFARMALEDKEYYISLLRRNESLTATPRINISTIHGAKGGEADHVVLLSDIAATTWKAQNLDQDSEHRVWYVGATRCRESLHIVLPRARYNYSL